MPYVLGNLSVCLCKLSFIPDTFGISWMDVGHVDCLRCPGEVQMRHRDSESVLMGQARHVTDRSMLDIRWAFFVYCQHSLDGCFASTVILNYGC